MICIGMEQPIHGKSYEIQKPLCRQLQKFLFIGLRMSSLDFKTTHNLLFESAQWPVDPSWQKFRVGTCYGLWRSNKDCYEILSINNREPGNGHLTDALEWFYQSCKRDNMNLIICEFMNKKFKRHLIKYEGFKSHGQNDLIKTFRHKKS